MERPEGRPDPEKLASALSSSFNADPDVAWGVRRAAFEAILATGKPWDPRGFTIEGVDASHVRAAVDHLVAAGRARIDERGRVTAAAGLSVDPTPHRIETARGAWWTNCAYDALGILGALGEDGVIESISPGSGALIHVAFQQGRPSGSDAVLFFADPSCCTRPNDEWCPNVNLFVDASAALAWAGEHGVAGRVLTLEEGTELGSLEWRPLIGGGAGLRGYDPAPRRAPDPSG